MKRSRFTVTMADGRYPKYVILAYSAQDARAYFEKRGEVVSVEAGDYRRQNRDERIKSRGGFQFDRRAFDRAVRDLGLKRPVDVRFHARVGGTNGNYRLKGHRHDIMVKSYLSPEQATQTLYHELMHAAQAERAGDSVSWNAVCKQQRSYPYRIRPIEVEARQFADKMKHIPLTTDPRN